MDGIGGGRINRKSVVSLAAGSRMFCPGFWWQCSNSSLAALVETAKQLA